MRKMRGARHGGVIPDPGGPGSGDLGTHGDAFDCPVALEPPPDDILALDQALEKLNDEDSLAAQVAILRLFAGLTLEEAANGLRISRTTAYRQWTFARAWLRAELRDDDDAEGK